MDDEVELFECQIAEGLMTIGWIHSHPQFVSLFIFGRDFLKLCFSILCVVGFVPVVC